MRRAEVFMVEDNLRCACCPSTKRYKLICDKPWSMSTRSTIKRTHGIPVVGDAFNKSHPDIVCDKVRVVSYGKIDLGVIRELLCFMRIMKRPHLDYSWVIECRYRNEIVVCKLEEDKA